jgi:beta-galactosidase
MWNHHEREPGVFDFESGNRDVAGFIRLCAEEGMWVYLRPGPYICGEWTNGGLPAWLLRDPDTRLRTRDDPRYMAAVRRYIGALAPRVAPLMASAGGPVLMLQIENEYSMFADDIGYLDALRDIWRDHGIDGPFSVSDGWKDLQRRKAYPRGTALGLDGADVADLLKGRGFAGESPVWVGEGYPGWLTHWGEPTFATKDYEETLRHIMSAGYSFNLYVVHGGTNFGLAVPARHHQLRLWRSDRRARASHVPVRAPAPCDHGYHADHAAHATPRAAFGDVRAGDAAAVRLLVGQPARYAGDPAVARTE